MSGGVAHKPVTTASALDTIWQYAAGSDPAALLARIGYAIA